MRIRILRSAVDDLVRGRKFYETQGEGMGEYFAESLSADIESPRLFAGVHSKSHGYYRRLSDRFPYAVYYEIEADDIRIHAILDCRRDPNWVRARLKK